MRSMKELWTILLLQPSRYLPLCKIKKKKKKEKEKAQEPHGGDGKIGGTDCIYFPN